jgi:hypothetical protein
VARPACCSATGAPRLLARLITPPRVGSGGNASPPPPGGVNRLCQSTCELCHGRTIHVSRTVFHYCHAQFQLCRCCALLLLPCLPLCTARRLIPFCVLAPPLLLIWMHAGLIADAERLTWSERLHGQQQPSCARLCVVCSFSTHVEVPAGHIMFMFVYAQLACGGMFVRSMWHIVACSHKIFEGPL